MPTRFGDSGSEQGAKIILSDEPLVTIFTPSYNHELFIDDYFAGLLSQSYRNLELIIFDDGSTDGTWEKLSSYRDKAAASFTNVWLERHENIGPNRESDLGLLRAQGELFCFLESDDFYLPTKIEENVNYLLAHPEMAAVHSDCHLIYEDRIQYHHWRTLGMSIPEGHIFRPLLESNFVMTCSLCCRTELLRRHVSYREYDSKGYLMGDYPIMLDLSWHHPIGYIDRALAYHRVLPESLSRSRDELKNFEFFRSYYQIAMNYSHKYHLPKSSTDLYSERYYRHLFRQGYSLFLKEACEQGYQWLRARGLLGHPSPIDGLRILSLRDKRLWRILRTLEGNRLARGLWRMARRLVSRESR